MLKRITVSAAARGGLDGLARIDPEMARVEREAGPPPSRARDAAAQQPYQALAARLLWHRRHQAAGRSSIDDLAAAAP